VLTTLTREAMPVVRFVLGDYVRLIEHHGCLCGRQSPVIEHFGRDLNRFRLGDRWVWARDLEQRRKPSGPTRVSTGAWRKKSARS
jgi:phenylacetate-coenzyme A ligase PaaK-like adenylate-forming protein